MWRVTPRKSTTSGGGADDLLVVELRVGGDDRHRVGVGQAGVEVGRGELQHGQLRHVGVVVGDLAAALAKKPRDLQRRRLARVADPGLVADAEEQDPRAAHRLARLVEGALDPLRAEGRLRLVDFAGQLDELGVELVLRAP